MNKRKYTLEMVEKVGLTRENPSWTPLDNNMRLTTRKMDEIPGVEDDPPLEGLGLYQRKIVRLFYLTLTRQEICLPVEILS